MRPSDTPASMPNRAESRMKRGNEYEIAGGRSALVSAVQCYQEAYTLLDTAETAHLPDRSRLLGLARMNEGNAQLKIGARENVEKAIQAYDQAIAWLEKMPFATVARDRNSLGAVWMNRGHALHGIGTPEAIAQAVVAFRTSTELLQALPLDEDDWFRINLSGAWMNHANALLSRAHGTDDYRESRDVAQKALQTIASLESTRVEAADLGLKSRRVFCDAIGQLLPIASSLGLSDRELATEASDAVESGLALARNWPRFALNFEPIILRLFRFGAMLYRINQPHFLAEYIKENLPSETMSKHAREEWYEIATEAVSAACADAGKARHYIIGDPDSERSLTTAKELAELEKWLRR